MISNSSNLGFTVVEESKTLPPTPQIPEEHVFWRNDQEIEFKIILREHNTERQRYLVLSKIEKALFILRWDT